MKAKRFLTVFCLGLTVSACIALEELTCHQSATATMPAATQMLTPVSIGTIANGIPQFGYTELALTGGTGQTGGTAGSSGVLNLASSATTIGTSGAPCYNLTLIPTLTYTGTGTASLYMGSGTATCTCLLMSGGSNQYGGKTGGLLTVSGTNSAVTYTQDGTLQKTLALPQVLNTNQLWFKLTDSASSTTTSQPTANVEAVYTQ